jgi:hypothetical protein
MGYLLLRILYMFVPSLSLSHTHTHSHTHKHYNTPPHNTHSHKHAFPTPQPSVSYELLLCFGVKLKSLCVLPKNISLILIQSL